MYVKKAYEKWRMCVDYTGLNRACPQDTYQLTNIDTYLPLITKPNMKQSSSDHSSDEDRGRNVKLKTNSQLAIFQVKREARTKELLFATICSPIQREALKI